MTTPGSSTDEHPDADAVFRAVQWRDFESADLNALRVPDAVKELGSIGNAHVEVRGVRTNCQGERADEPPGTAGTPQTQGAPRHD